MPIIVKLDVMLATRKMRSKELAERVGITERNVSNVFVKKTRTLNILTLQRSPA